jgi:adenylosuccinate lyase
MNDGEQRESSPNVDASFDTAYHLKHVDTIFRRVFGE